MHKNNSSLTGATNLVGADAAGTDADGFALAARQDHLAFLQVRILEKAVVLVRKADFVGFITAFAANFAGARHSAMVLWFR